MKKFLVFIPVLFFAAGCNASQPGLEEKVYPVANNTNPAPVPAPAAPAQTTEVKIAVIALNDAGKNGPKIGCDDSMVYIGIILSQGTTQPLNEAMRQLFEYGTETVAEPGIGQDLYNVIPKMKDLKFGRATLENGVAKLYLTGNTAGLGGVCDSPRVQAQIEGTAKQFPTVTSVETYLNDKKINWQEFGSQR